MVARRSPIQILAKFYCDLDPVDRYERFHKPLAAALCAADFGDVTGGGTMEDLESGAVLFSDLHIAVRGDLDAALAVIRATLQACGAPSGTELVVEETNAVIRLELH
jgi:hypothetical protein